MIAGLARKHRLRVDPPLIGSKATKSAIKSEWGRYSTIHLAAHAFYDNLNPLYSGIVLAQDSPDSPQNGILEAREILDQDLSANLVILSACDTARGAIYGGEGPVGLSWALFVAGTPASVVTQWRVADQSSATFMQSFYRRWGFGMPGAGNKSKSIALQLAQENLLKSTGYSHPHYWAPFVMIGDSR